MLIQCWALQGHAFSQECFFWYSNSDLGRCFHSLIACIGLLVEFYCSSPVSLSACPSVDIVGLFCWIVWILVCRFMDSISQKSAVGLHVVNP